MMNARTLLFALTLLFSACTVERDDAEAQTDTTYRIDRVIVPEPRPSGPLTEDDDTTRLPPIDEAVEAPGFFVYRMRMIEAVGARDTTALFEMMADDVRISFGDAGGRSGFREMWTPSHPDSEVWELLGRVLGGGGRYEEGPFTLDTEQEATARFVAPYYFAAFAGERYDPFQHGVILDESVPVREKPEPDAPAIDTLSFAIVRVPNFMPHETQAGNWVRVELSDDRFGYVPARRVASPIGYRAVFHRIDGQWLMTSFVAGD